MYGCYRHEDASAGSTLLPSSDLLMLAPELMVAVFPYISELHRLPVLKHNPIVNVSKYNLSMDNQGSSLFAQAVAYVEEVEVLVSRNDRDKNV
jgi:hypothetical protein